MDEMISQLNWDGVIIGLITFIIIGIFHPLVIKGYYYIGLKCRWIFLISGIGFIIGCLLTASTMLSIILGVTAFSCFWSIMEINEQKLRVERVGSKQIPNIKVI